MDNILQTKEENFSFIGSGASIEGDLSFSIKTCINCQIKGSIQMLQGATLRIERNAKITGKLEGHDMDILGEVIGDIHSNGKVKIFPCALIEGKIDALHIEIAPGAVVNTELKTSNLGHQDGHELSHSLGLHI